MKVNVVSRKLVKPYKPTPQLQNISPRRNQSSHQSLLQNISSIHATVVAPMNQNLFAWKNQWLKSSPTIYYPLAGRYDREIRQVDCNDKGAYFSTSEADGNLSQIISAGVEPKQLNQLLPIDVSAADNPTDPLLAIQVNRFECGGLAIGVCGSHRVMDAAVFALFLSDLAKAAASGGSLLNQPYFYTHSYFPAENLPPLDYDGEPEKLVMRRLVLFDREAIQKLRQQLTEWNSSLPPSRVAVVSAFLTRPAVIANQ